MATADLQVQVSVTLPRDYLMTERQSLLLRLDALEILLGITPRTSEIRKEHKAANPPPQYNCELEYDKKMED